MSIFFEKRPSSVEVETLTSRDGMEHFDEKHSFGCHSIEYYLVLMSRKILPCRFQIDSPGFM